MIQLHRLHGNGSIVVNADLIESVEACPDTVVTLVTKRRFVVDDTIDDVIDRIIGFRAAIAARAAGGDDLAAGARAMLASETTIDEAA